MKITPSTNDILDVTRFEYYSGADLKFSGTVLVTRSQDLYTVQTSVAEMELNILSKYTSKLIDFISTRNSMVNIITFVGGSMMKLYLPIGITLVKLYNVNDDLLFELTKQSGSNASGKKNEWQTILNNYLSGKDGDLSDTSTVTAATSYNIIEENFDRVVTILNSDEAQNLRNNSEVLTHKSKSKQHLSQLTYIWYDLNNGFMISKMMFEKLIQSRNAEFNSGLLICEDMSKYIVGTPEDSKLVTHGLSDTVTTADKLDELYLHNFELSAANNVVLGPFSREVLIRVGYSVLYRGSITLNAGILDKNRSATRITSLSPTDGIDQFIKNDILGILPKGESTKITSNTGGITLKLEELPNVNY